MVRQIHANVTAAIQVELARFLAGQTKRQETVLGYKSNRAYDPSGHCAVFASVVDYQYKIVDLLHNSTNQ
jgi:hypothetical protein